MLSVVLNERPTGGFIPGKTICEVEVPAPTEADLKDGQVLIQPYYLSLDPAIRGWVMDQRSYVEPIQIGEVLRGLTVGKVLASKNPRFPAEDLCMGWSGWRELAVLNEDEIFPVSTAPGTELPDSLGALGKCVGRVRERVAWADPSQARPV